MWFCISVFVTFVHAASNLKSLNHKINYKKKWAHEILTRKKFWPTRKNFKLTNTHEEVLDPPNTDEKKFQSHEIPMKSRWHDGGRFLLFDSGIGDINRTFIFATNDEIDMLADPSQWFGDGTSNLTLRHFLKYIQFMLWSIMTFFPVFLHIYHLKLKLYMSNISQQYATL